MTTPAVTVVVPVCDAELIVAGVVDRLADLEPVPGGIEVLVVDDASADATADRAELAAEAHTGIRVIRRSRRGGPTAARRTGYAEARGWFVWHADVDDEWDRTVVAHLHEVALSTGADVAVCRARRVEANGRSWTMEGVSRDRTVDAGSVGDLVLDGTIRGYLWNKLVRRDLLRADDHDPIPSQDDLLVVVHVLAEARLVALVPDVLYTYRERPGSVSTAPAAAPRFESLERCVTEVRRAFGGPGPERPDGWRWAGFETWFLLVPALTTPAHQAWPADRVDAVLAAYLPRLTWRGIVGAGRLQGIRPVLFAAGAKVFGHRYPSVYRRVGRVAGFSLRAAP